MLSGNKQAFRSISWLCENGAALTDSGKMARPGGYCYNGAPWRIEEEEELLFVNGIQ